MNLPGLRLLLKFVSFVIASFVAVHFLAFLGIFIALAYPLWWLIAPDQTICFGCRIFKTCPFCGAKDDQGSGNNPRTFGSAVLNSLVILIFSAICLGIVILESRFVFKMGFPPTPKTVSFVIPAKGQYRIGELFSMPIQVSGVGKSINAVQADVGFDPAIVKAVEISTKGSFANVFLQKEIDNNLGYTRLTGGLPNPGFAYENGTFGIIFFQGVSPGLARIDFLPSSMVLANDGKGTNVLKDLAFASYLILPEKLSDRELEEQQVMLTPDVLGEETDDQVEETSLIFYEEKKILGTSLKDEVKKDTADNLGSKIIGSWEKTIFLIVSFWYRFFEALINLFS
ncbi:MAG: cohesin domain-containing protein [Candidatus Shapirobacteria bacterium]|nr:cohesin domain-containing protein [Candidatus Shapirobacteria bacterium]